MEAEWSKNGSLLSTIISSNTAANSISIQQFYIHFPQDFTCASLLSLQIKFSMFFLYNLNKNTKNSGSCVLLIYIACMGLDEIKQGRLRCKSSLNWGVSSRFKTGWIFQLLFLLNWCKGWLTFSGKGAQWSQINKICHSNSLTYPENHNGVYRRGGKKTSVFYSKE